MRIHHIALRTPALARLERFYADLLGLPVVRRTDRSVWLAVGDAWLMLEHADPREPPIPHGSAELVAFAIPPADRALRRARLEAAGVVVESETAFTLYVRDPDGRRIGLSHYPADPDPPSSAT